MWPIQQSSIEARPLQAVLADHVDLVRRLRLCYGESEQCFDDTLLPLLHRYASYVHGLPATPDAHFCAPGGLLRLGLEVGFFSLQGCDVRIFSGRATMERRRALEPRWRLATFIAGLCCELYRVPGQIEVVSTTGQVWPCQLQPLHDWLAHSGMTCYRVQWRQRSRPLVPWGLLVLNHIVTPRDWAYLGQDNDEIIPDLLCSVAGLAMGDSVIDDLVRNALAVVVEQDLRRQALLDGGEHHGAHFKRFFLEALRRLMLNHPRWQINHPNALLIRHQDGLHLRWPQGGFGLLQALSKLDLPGMPPDNVRLLARLEAMELVMRPAPHKFYFTAIPSTGELVTTLRLVDGEWLLHPLPSMQRGEVLEVPEAHDPQVAHSGDAMEPEDAVSESGQCVGGGSLAGTDGHQDGEVDALEAAGLPEGERAMPVADEFLVPAGRRELIRFQCLDHRVTEALAHLVRQLDQGDGEPEIVELAQGYFVPQLSLRRHRLDVKKTVRQLEDAGMLVKGPKGVQVFQEIRGKKIQGVVLDPRCVRCVES